MRHERETKERADWAGNPLPEWLAPLIEHLDHIVEELLEDYEADPDDVAAIFTAHAAGTFINHGFSREEAFRAIKCTANAALFKFSNELTGIAPVAGNA